MQFLGLMAGLFGLDILLKGKIEAGDKEDFPRDMEGTSGKIRPVSYTHLWNSPLHWNLLFQVSSLLYRGSPHATVHTPPKSGAP